jgi:flavin-dependent dehydrogenase
VALIEQDDYQSFRVGETLAPFIRAKLTTLGLWDQFLACGPLESYGIRSAWENSTARHQDFVRNPYGCGWHVDRARFDSMLASAAAQAAAQLFISARVSSWHKEADRHWQLEVAQGEALLNLSGRMLVDATGRRALLACKLGSQSRAVDRLIAAVTLCDCRDTEQWTLIEAVEEGWWYSAPLPGARMVFTYMTDSDLWKRAKWADLVKSAPLTAQRAGDIIVPPPMEIVSAGSLMRQPVVGDDWLAIGDAALAFDPLSGQGVLKSMETGTSAADAIARYFDGDGTSLAMYQNWVQEVYQEHLAVRSQFYQSVRRWPASQFWTRRAPR